MDMRSDRQKGLSYVELGKKYHMDPWTAKRCRVEHHLSRTSTFVRSKAIDLKGKIAGTLTLNSQLIGSIIGGKHRIDTPI